MAEAKKLSMTEFLMKVREGGAVEELRQAVEDCTRAVNVTGKPGKVTLTMEIKPNGNTAVFVKDTIAAKLPEPNKEDTLFYVTDDGGLSRRNPSQLRMGDLEVVES